MLFGIVPVESVDFKVFERVGQCRTVAKTISVDNPDQLVILMIRGRQSLKTFVRILKLPLAELIRQVPGKLNVEESATNQR